MELKTGAKNLKSIMNARKIEDEEVRIKKLGENSSERLSKIITKKINTAFIGAISTFEGFFGKIWGHGLHKEDCTENQLKWRALWEEARAKIFDKGNDQGRAAEQELLLYDVFFKGYQYEAEVKINHPVNTSYEFESKLVRKQD